MGLGWGQGHVLVELGKLRVCTIEQSNNNGLEESQNRMHDRLRFWIAVEVMKNNNNNNLSSEP